MMNSTVKRLISLIFAGMLLAALLTACGESPDDKQAKADTELSESNSLATITPDVFAEADLTMVNAFATWCSPCVKEIPELDQLNKDFADKNVNVIGVVLDAVDPRTGSADKKALDAAEQLRAKTGISYSFYAPDYTLFGGIFGSISSVPTTFFVNNCGEIVGEAYIGARSLEDWTKIVEFEMGRDTVVETREART